MFFGFGKKMFFFLRFWPENTFCGGLAGIWVFGFWRENELFQFWRENLCFPVLAEKCGFTGLTEKCVFIEIYILRFL